MKPKITSSDLLSQQDFEVRHISPTIDRSILNEAPHRHPFQEIIYIKSGKGKHSIDGEVFELEADTIYVIGEGQVHDFLEGSQLKGYLLRYKLTVLPPELTMYATDYSILQVISDSNSLRLAADEIAAFDNNFNSLITEYSQEKLHVNNHVFHFILLTLLSRINQKIKNVSAHVKSDQDSVDQKYKKLVLLIEEHYKDEHDLTYYASQLGLRNRQLSILTQAQTGMTAKQVINARLIIEAKRLLRFTNMSFKEIAFELGYKEPAYFSRLFKRKTGLSPKAFKERLKL